MILVVVTAYNSRDSKHDEVRTPFSHSDVLIQITVTYIAHTELKYCYGVFHGMDENKQICTNLNI